MQPPALWSCGRRCHSTNQIDDLGCSECQVSQHVMGNVGKRGSQSIWNRPFHWPCVADHARPLEREFSGVPPEQGKQQENIGFGFPRKTKKYQPKTKETEPKNPIFGATFGLFSYFSAIFPVFWRPRPIFS